MARATELTASDLAALVGPGATIIAMTDEGSDPRYAAVRAAAASIATAADARILLFHAPPGQVDPTARRWRLFEHAEGPAGPPERTHTISRRGDALRRQASSLREDGLHVSVFVTDRPSAAGIAEAVEVTRAALVLMPAEVERPGRVRRTLHYRAARVAAPVISVDPDGTLALVSPLGARAKVEFSSWTRGGVREAFAQPRTGGSAAEGGGRA